MEEPQLVKGREHEATTGAQASPNDFDDISAALKDEARLLDAREEAIIKREAELAKREEDSKLAEAARSLTLHAKSQVTPSAMSFDSSALSSAHPPLTGSTGTATQKKARKVQPRDHGW